MKDLIVLTFSKKLLVTENPLPLSLNNFSLKKKKILNYPSTTNQRLTNVLEDQLASLHNFQK